MIGNKIGSAVAKPCNGKIFGVSKHPQQNNSETVKNEHDKEIPKEWRISPEERQKIIKINYNSIILQHQKNNKFVRQYTKPAN